MHLSNGQRTAASSGDGRGTRVSREDLYGDWIRGAQGKIRIAAAASEGAFRQIKTHQLANHQHNSTWITYSIDYSGKDSAGGFCAHPNLIAGTNRE